MNVLANPSTLEEPTDDDHDMGFDLLQLGVVIGQGEIARPPDLPVVDLLQRRLPSQVGPSGCQFLDFGHGQLQGFVRYRHRSPYDRHAQKLDPIRARHWALLAVHHQCQSLLDIAADAAHHPFGRLRRAHEDVAVIGESAKFKAAPLQLFVQFV